jgi:hypothetical protein
MRGFDNRATTQNATKSRAGSKPQGVYYSPASVQPMHAQHNWLINRNWLAIPGNRIAITQRIGNEMPSKN